MTRREFLKVCGLGAASRLLYGVHSTPPSYERPNILWLDAEDLSPDLGCYGNKLVHTPNIDRLAREGVIFTNAFVTGPVCSSSRSAVATGMYQTSIGAHNHRSNRDKPLPKGVKHFSYYLRKAGYYVCNCQALQWNRRGKMDYNFKLSFEEAFDGTDWSGRKPGQPFFAEVHFHEAHRPFRPDPENPIDPDEVEIPPYYPDHPVTRKDWALYLETIQLLDKKVGQVLKRLEEEGLAENTVVFFWGDHGRAMVRGKQFLYEGGIRIPLIVRWPGKVRPGTVVDDLVSAIDLTVTWLRIAGVDPPENMQGLDLFSGETAKRRYIFAARDRCDETVDRIRCVRTKRFKYIRNFYPDRPYTQFNAYKKLQYPVLTLMEVLHKQGKLTPEQERFMSPTRPEEELYDLENDPYELHNLAGDPRYQDVLRELRGALERWMEETNDQGALPEDPEVLEYWRREAEERFERRMRERGLSPDVSPEEYLRWWEGRLGLR